MISQEDQIVDLVESLGIEIKGQTASNIYGMCPFHENNETHSFAVNKTNGLWYCFNSVCGAKGNLAQLVDKLAGEQRGSLARIMSKMGVERRESLNLEDEFSKIFDEDQSEEEDVDWDSTMQSLSVDYNPESENKLQYLIDRGYTPPTLKAFEVGFATNKKRIVIPIRDESFKMVGLVGRATSSNQQPKYLYSKNLPKKHILFNLCHAKTYNSVIIVEGTLDALSVHQAGFPNVVASLGSGFSNEQADLVNRFFADVIIFGDNDDAGKALGTQIADKCSKRNIYYAQYPPGKNDPGEMTGEEIEWAITNMKSQIDILLEAL